MTLKKKLFWAPKECRTHNLPDTGWSVLTYCLMKYYIYFMTFLWYVESENFLSSHLNHETSKSVADRSAMVCMSRWDQLNGFWNLHTILFSANFKYFSASAYGNVQNGLISITLICVAGECSLTLLDVKIGLPYTHLQREIWNRSREAKWAMLPIVVC